MRATPISAVDDGLMGKAFGQLRQFICSLHGHDALLHFESGRMSLRCTSCDYETPGWDLRERCTITAQPRYVRLSQPMAWNHPGPSIT